MSAIALTIISILSSFIIALIIYIFCSRNRESVLSAKNDSLAIERTKTEKETNGLRDKIVKLETERVKFDKDTNELKEKIITLETEKADLASKGNVRVKYVFNDKYGIFKSREKDHYFCPSCMTKNIESPMRTEKTGWTCLSKDCLFFVPNEKHKPPKRIIHPGVTIDDF